MTRLRGPRAAAAVLDAVVLEEGELAIDTTADELRLGDGATLGGWALARKDGSNLTLTPAGADGGRSPAEWLSDVINVKADWGDGAWVGDGGTDNTAAFDAPLSAGLDGPIVEIPEGIFLFDDTVLFEGVGKLKIRGQGPGRTILKFGAAAAGGDYALELTGQFVVGALSITYNVGDGETTAVENPSTYLSSAALARADQIVVNSATGISVGCLLRLKSQQLFVGDHRNSTYVGEICRVAAISGTTVTLETPLYFGYRSTSAINSSTASAGSSTTITIATGLAQTIVGCRVTLTGGTGSGQIRYITSYDSATGVCQIGTSGSFDQADFSPAPDNTTTYTIDAPTYVTIINPIELEIEDLTIDASAVSTDIVPFGVSGGMRPKSRNVVSIASSTIANGSINFRQCYEPDCELAFSSDCGENTGHSILSAENVRARFSGMRSTRTRRGGVDAGGRIPNIAMRVENFNIAAAGRQGDGDAYDGQGLESYGIGDHGNNYLATYCNGTIHGATVPLISRGVATSWEDITVSGDCKHVIELAGGRDARLRRIKARLLPPAEITSNGATAVYPVSPGTPTRRAVSITASFLADGGGFDMQDCEFDNLTDDAISIDVASGYLLTSRFIVKNNRFSFNSSSTRVMIRATAALNFNGSEIYENKLENTHATPGIVDFTGTIGAGDGTNPYWNKRGPAEWEVYLPDDTATYFPYPTTANQAELRIFQRNSASTYYFAGVVRELASTVVAEYVTTPANVVNEGDLLTTTTQFAGTTGTDTNLSFGLNGSQFCIENRTGGARFFSVLIN